MQFGSCTYRGRRFEQCDNLHEVEEKHSRQHHPCSEMDVRLDLNVGMFEVIIGRNDEADGRLVWRLLTFSVPVSEDIVIGVDVARRGMLVAISCEVRSRLLGWNAADSAFHLRTCLVK